MRAKVNITKKTIELYDPYGDRWYLLCDNVDTLHNWDYHCYQWGITEVHYFEEKK